MKLDIFNINDFIKQNQLQEVTSPTANLNGSHHPEGVLSDEIFGMDRDARKNTFAYIDLSGTGKDHYIHPMLYEMIQTRMKWLNGVIAGEKYAIVDAPTGQRGPLKVVPPETKGAGTGLDFLYNNFKRIDWEKDDPDQSVDISFRDKLFNKLDRDEFFINKWLVVPAYYREESSLEGTMGDELNKLYKELIMYARSMKIDYGFQLFNASTKMAIQQCLLTVYRSTMSPLTGKHLQPNGTWAGSAKNALFRKNLLGKTVDFTVATVISSPNNSMAKSPKDLPAKFGYGGFPLINVVSMFQPFFVAYMSEFLTNYLEQAEQKIRYKRFNMYQFSNKEIEHILKGYMKSEHERFKPIMFYYIDENDEKRWVQILMKEYDGSIPRERILEEERRLTEEPGYKAQLKPIAYRPLTYTDLIYISAIDIVKDKHVLVTRYPIAFYQNISPVKVNVLSTRRTTENVWIWVPGLQRMYKFDKYPIVDDTYMKKHPETQKLGRTWIFTPKKNKNDSQFFDHLIPDIATIPALNADFDGDVLTFRGLFTTEANREADAIVYAKKNIFNSAGKVSRGIVSLGKDVVLAAYSLTKE